jgi:hypothetical protein
LNQRADFLKATKQLRQLVDKATNEYALLRMDPEVKHALQTVRRTNSTVSIGPSKHLTTTIGRLRRAEEIVSFDPDAYRRKSKMPAAPRPDPNQLETPRIASPEPTGDLVLTDLAVNSSAGGTYVEVEGRFRNTSGRDLQRIRVTVFMEDRAGKLVKSESTFCQPTTISSGGVGSFSVMAAANTRYAQVKMEFLGHEKAIPWIDRSGKDAHQ